MPKKKKAETETAEQKRVKELWPKHGRSSYQMAREEKGAEPKKKAKRVDEAGDEITKSTGDEPNEPTQPASEDEASNGGEPEEE